MGRQEQFDSGRYSYKIMGPLTDNSMGFPGNTHVVAYKHDENGEITPVGSMIISAGQNSINRQISEEINIANQNALTSNTSGQSYSDKRLSRSGMVSENEKGQIPGQMRFVNGVFGREIPSSYDTDIISSLHIDQGHERALGGMIAAGIDAHGTIPRSDYALSQHGSRIARAAARRYGIKGHPGNPTMKPTFNMSDEHRSDPNTSIMADMDLQLESVDSGQEPREVTHAEAKAMEKTIKANMPKSKAKRRKAEKERIARGKAENVQLELDI